MTPVRVGMETERLLSRIFAFVVVAIGALSMLLPFFWMLTTSLKDPGAIFLYPPQWIPSFRWKNFSEALTVLPFGRFYANTIFMTAAASLGNLVSASLTGYAFARLRAPGRGFLFVLVISTMLLPVQVTMIPVFLIFKTLRAINTFTPLILPSWLGAGAFYIFLCRQFFLTLPLELDDAAKIDGCGVMAIYWRIVLPLSRPVLAAIVAFSVVEKWNEFLFPVIYLQSESKYVVSIGLRLFQDLQSTSYNWLMAAAVVTMIPPLVVFFLVQRAFVQGIATTGLKG